MHAQLQRTHEVERADKGYQDVAFYASFRCTGACKTGALVARGENAGCLKGVYVSLAEGNVAAYHLVLDERGQRTPPHQIGSRSPVR